MGTAGEHEVDDGRPGAGKLSRRERSLLRDVIWVALWIALYVLLISRWSGDRAASIFFPIISALYTVLGVVAVVYALRDWAALRRERKGPKPS
jgi:hypothetical protein